MKQKASQNSGTALCRRLSGILAVILCIVLYAGDFAQAEKNAKAPLIIRQYQSDNKSLVSVQNGDTPDWIELYNSGSEPLSLKGFFIINDTKPNKTFTFPDYTLKGSGTVLILADGGDSAADTGFHADFRLAASGGETILLYDNHNRLLDQVKTAALPVDASCCRNSEGEWEICQTASPVSLDSFVSAKGFHADAFPVTPGKVVFSEAVSSNAVAFPDENGAYPDYIELRNTSSHTVNLEGYSLSDDAANLQKWTFPSVQLPAGGFLAIHCSGENRADNTTHLHTNFKLSSDGEQLFLSDATQTLIDTLTLPALEDGQVLSLVDGTWTDKLAPTPNLENTLSSVSALDTQKLASNPYHVYISEVLALSDETCVCDWLEITNDSDATVNLSGFGLSDNPCRLRKWQFPTGTKIDAHQAMIVALPGADEVSVTGYLKTSFALSGDGGYPVCLSTPDGVPVDVLYLPVQYTNISYGRNGFSGPGYYGVPTPGKVNTDSPMPVRAEPARYSVPGGVYHSGDAFSVTLTADAGARIYYTLDCTDPDESSTLYTAPIPISGTTILRTRVYREGCLESMTNTQSYLYDVGNAHDVPYVVSLVSDPDNLYSDKRGIMVKGPKALAEFPFGKHNYGANFWMDWEREAHIELFADGTETAISQNCGIKIHGRNTRAYQLQSFKLLAKECYGDSLFRYPIFSDRDYTEYESILLRYTGQDFQRTFLRDPAFISLAANTDLLYQEAEECIVYLNGEYYSAMYLRETVNPYFICQARGWEGQEDDIDLVRGAITLLQGSDEDFLALRSWLDENDASSQEAYDRINAIVDIDNFIEYAVFAIVMAKPDTVDVKRYRNPLADGKWRWIVYDFDRCLQDEIDGFELLAQGSYRSLFKAFMVNPVLRERFLDYFAESLAGLYSSENLLKTAQAQYKRIEPVLPDYLANVGVSRGNYNNYLKKLVNHINKAPRLAIEQCAGYLNLSEEEVNSRFADALQAIQDYQRKHP